MSLISEAAGKHLAALQQAEINGVTFTFGPKDSGTPGSQDVTCSVCGKQMDQSRAHEHAATHTKTSRKVSSTPDWLSERNNDPYGTPTNHAFWESVDFEDVGDMRVFERDGKGYLHHRRQNYWMNFNSIEEAREHAQTSDQGLDMWASRKTAGLYRILWSDGQESGTFDSEASAVRYAFEDGDLDARIKYLPTDEVYESNVGELASDLGLRYRADGEIYEAKRKTAATCSCAHYDDGSVGTTLCPIHADEDPCWTIARVTGKRRKGSIVNGVCSNCGWTARFATGSRKTAAFGDGNKAGYTGTAAQAYENGQSDARNGMPYHPPAPDTIEGDAYYEGWESVKGTTASRTAGYYDRGPGWYIIGLGDTALEADNPDDPILEGPLDGDTAVKHKNELRELGFDVKLEYRERPTFSPPPAGAVDELIDKLTSRQPLNVWGQNAREASYPVGEYVVVNTDTNEVLSEVFSTVEEAEAAMNALNPPELGFGGPYYNGFDVPLAVAPKHSVKTAAPLSFDPDPIWEGMEGEAEIERQYERKVKWNEGYRKGKEDADAGKPFFNFENAPEDYPGGSDFRDGYAAGWRGYQASRKLAEIARGDLDLEDGIEYLMYVYNISREEAEEFARNYEEPEEMTQAEIDYMDNTGKPEFAPIPGDSQYRGSKTSAKKLYVPLRDNFAGEITFREVYGDAEAIIARARSAGFVPENPVNLDEFMVSRWDGLKLDKWDRIKDTAVTFGSKTSAKPEVPVVLKLNEETGEWEEYPNAYVDSYGRVSVPLGWGGHNRSERSIDSLMAGHEIQVPLGTYKLRDGPVRYDRGVGPLPLASRKTAMNSKEVAGRHVQIGDVYWNGETWLRVHDKSQLPAWDEDVLLLTVGDKGDDDVVRSSIFGAPYQANRKTAVDEHLESELWCGRCEQDVPHNRGRCAFCGNWLLDEDEDEGFTLSRRKANMFPGAGAQVYYNEAGEPLGWDYPPPYTGTDWDDTEVEPDPEYLGLDDAYSEGQYTADDGKPYDPYFYDDPKQQQAYREGYENAGGVVASKTAAADIANLEVGDRVVVSDGKGPDEIYATVTQLNPGEGRRHDLVEITPDDIGLDELPFLVPTAWVTKVTGKIATHIPDEALVERSDDDLFL